MATIDYVALADLAKTLIEDTGRSVTFIKLSQAEDDVTKPWRGTTDPRATPEDSVAATATFVPPTGLSELGFKTEQPEWVKRSTQICITALGSASSDDLTDFDEMIDGSTRWKITGVDKLQPASTTLLYFVGLRR